MIVDRERYPEWGKMTGKIGDEDLLVVINTTPNLKPSNQRMLINTRDRALAQSCQLELHKD